TDVRIVNFLRAPSPQTIICRNVKYALNAPHRAIERRRVAQISRHVLERQIRNRAIRARSAQQHAHFISARYELPRHVATQKTGRACNQRGHATLTPSSFACDFCSRGREASPPLRATCRLPLTMGSRSREKDSHQMFPINFRASTVFWTKVSAFALE